VVAEGEVTEPDYCTALNNHFKDEHQFYINTRYSRKNGLHPLEVAEGAVTIASDPRERGDNGPVHEVWALFDRDQHTDVREAFARVKEHNAEAAAGHADGCDPLYRDPSTDVWHLIQSLGIAPRSLVTDLTT
jgi:hypothetical protein